MESDSKNKGPVIEFRKLPSHVKKPSDVRGAARIRARERLINKTPALGAVC